jgi:hypothetical protein
MLLGAAALAIGVAAPAAALVPETIVDRHNEEVGSIAFQTADRYIVENLDYKHESEVRRVNARRYNFWSKSRLHGYATRATSRRWNVYEVGHSERVGYVERGRTNRIWKAYGNGGGESAIGEAAGAQAIVGAASVLLVFDH